MTHAIVNRTESCLMCGASVVFQTLTSAHPEAPELLRTLSLTAWVGVVAEHAGGRVELLVTCSEDCARALLAEEAP